MIERAVKERKVTLLLALVLILFGLYAYVSMPKQENPDTSSPAAQIIFIYPGATAEEVETTITKKVEDAAATLEGVETLLTYSNPNSSVAVITLDYSVDYQAQWQALRESLDDLQNELPDQVMPYTLKTNLTDYAGMILSFSGDGLSYEALNDIAETYKSAIETVDGVGRIEIDGLPEKKVFVTVNSKKIAGTPLTSRDIFEWIAAQGASIPTGTIDTDEGRIGVKMPSGYDSVEELKDLVVYTSETGAALRLSDVANVETRYETGEPRYTHDGAPAILLTAYFEANKNVITVGADIQDALNALGEKYGEGLNVTPVLFQPDEVQSATRSFTMNLIQGVVFVIGVVLIGMGLRNALVVSTTIPLAIAITIGAMYLMGIQIHQISIAALIIALGMLVDNAIVVSDAIQVRLAQGEERFSASVLGAKESAIPVLTSTLTTLAAFAPLMTLPGEAGEFAKSLPQVVMIALTASYLAAMLVIPALASLLFKSGAEKNPKKNRLRHAFQTALEWSLRHRMTVYIVLAVVIAATAWLATKLEINLFPYADKDIFYVDIKADSPTETDALVASVESIIGEFPEVIQVDTAIGTGFPKFYLTVGITPPSEDVAQIICKVEPSETGNMDILADKLQTAFDSRLTGGSATARLIEINQPGAAIEVRVSGEDREKIQEVSQAVYLFLKERDGTVNVSSDAPSEIFQYAVEPDEDKVAGLGLTRYGIQYQTSLALEGMKAGEVSDGEDDLAIQLSQDIESIEDLMNVQVRSDYTGEKIAVRQFADVELSPSLDRIKRYNRQETVSITSDVRPGYTPNAVQSDLEAFLPTLDLSGVQIDYAGDQEVFDKYISGLMAAALFALAAVYLILLIQFNSFVQPLIILLTVPLSTVGSVLVLWLFRVNFTFATGLGIASLIGIVVNNAILLVEYINRERAEGNGVEEACLRSVDRRFRPIMLSTTTTVIGLLPLAWSNSSFFTPMALALMGGLMISTLLTLIVIPTVYASVHRKEL
jgi:multidrug efflux pump subunit AcrB